MPPFGRGFKKGNRTGSPIENDQWVAIAAETDDQWRALRRALGDPAWAADAALEGVDGRMAARAAIDAGISAWTQGRTPHEAHMHPRMKPRRPSAYELQQRGRKFPPHHLHESWLDYLYWDIELEA